MKKIIALIAALMMVLSLSACFGGNNAQSTADEVKLGDIADYDKDFKGLSKFISESVKGSSVQEIYYDILGADNGTRVVLNGNAYVEIYDFSSAKNDTAKAILEDVKDDGKFKPMADGIEMTAVLTDSGKYVIAWDASRGYNYEKDIVTDDLKANW